MTDKECEKEVKCTFDKFKLMCNEAQNMHDTLLGLLPAKEAEKHEIWYKAKMLSVNEFIDEVNMFLLMLLKMRVSCSLMTAYQMLELM